MPQTPLTDWEKDESGALTVRSLIGWGTLGASDGLSGVLRLEHGTEKQRAALQLHLSTLQVHELAEGLTRLAAYLKSASAGDKNEGPTS